jgi:hypothetical protein
MQDKPNLIATADELLAYMHTDDPAVEAESKPIPTTDSIKVVDEPKNSFLLTQFQLLSTPYFVIYLQGKKGSLLATLSPDLPEETLLQLAFKEAIFRKVGRNIPEPISALLSTISEDKHKFYTDKAWHKQILSKLIEYGTQTIVKEVAATRSYPLQAIDSYLNALAIYLNEQGFESVEAWLTNSATRIDLLSPNVWDDL